MTVSIDAFLVRNILLNLLSNAVKYSPEDNDIYWTIKSSKDQLLISVRDEGIGIPAEDQQNMFTRFYRASNASAIKGTGLGLTIIRRHLDLMQGDISFVSKEGKGTTFTVNIPLGTVKKI
jgi:signal transduction histidine kinase